MATPFEQRLKRAIRWIRKEHPNRVKRYEHPSFVACALLEEADKRFELNSFGVEGWASDDGRCGVSYLNFGDTYHPTILVKSDPSKACFVLAMGGWGSYVK